jgi:purine nucleoside phosphorylase
LEVWPVGWEPEQPVPKVLPAMYELHNINVENVSATTALGAIAGRLKVPVLVDHSALARHGIEPDKVMVSHPQSRTTYSTALGRILFQAELKSELRVDEADKPLLWVTTVKPM